MGRNINNLEPDGHGWRARLGVLTHDDSAISESELWTMAPDGVSLHTSRVFFADLATFADPPGPENATELLARLPLQAIIYAWTAGSYLLGTTGEQELVNRVEQHSNGIPVLMSAPAATAGFRALQLLVRSSILGADRESPAEFISALARKSLGRRRASDQARRCRRSL